MDCIKKEKKQEQWDGNETGGDGGQTIAWSASLPPLPRIQDESGCFAPQAPCCALGGEHNHPSPSS